MRILVIKLGAKGDVIRTLCILPAIKEKFGQDSHITWITRKRNSELLENHPLIDRIVPIEETYSFEERFDLLYNLDLDEESSNIALETNSVSKLGFYLEDKYPLAFNKGGEYYLETIFDDTLKRNNKKTYQEMIFEAIDLKWNGEKYKIYLGDKEMAFGNDFIQKNELTNTKIVGLHMGAGSRWPSKAWSKERLIEAIMLLKSQGYEVLLFSGPEEVKIREEVMCFLADKGVKVYYNNIGNSDREFASLVNICDYMICSDSFALHVSLALGKKTTGLFFCTSPNEIESYGLLTKIVSPLLYKFFPERSDVYSQELVNSVSAKEVSDTVKI